MTDAQLHALAAVLTPEQLAVFATAINAGTLTAEPKAAPKRTRKRGVLPIGVAKLRAAIEAASKAKGGCVRALGGSIAKQDHGRILDALGLKHTAVNSACVNLGLKPLVKAGGAWSHVDAKLRLHKAKSAKTTKAHAEALIARATKRVDEYRAG